MRIDAHQHFWDLSRFSYYWMPPGDSVLRRNYLPADLAPLLEEHRFDGTIAVQAVMDPGEASWLLSLAAANPYLKGVVAWVDLVSPTLPHTLDTLQRDPHFVGVRHPTHHEDDTRWLLRPGVLDGLRELARRGIPFDLMIQPPHLPLIALLAERVPDLRIVIDHLAKPLIASHVLEGWAEDLAAAAQLPQVFCKLSGLVTEADPQNWKAQDFAPYLAHALQIFTPARCMFGSDWPVCRLVASYKQVLAAFTQACGPLPQMARDQLLGETAIRFYRLPGA